MSEYIVDFYCEESGVKCEPIVRCRDCANFSTDELGDYCTLLDFEDVKSMADKFCAWASRKDES